MGLKINHDAYTLDRSGFKAPSEKKPYMDTDAPKSQAFAYIRRKNIN